MPGGPSPGSHNRQLVSVAFQLNESFLSSNPPAPQVPCPEFLQNLDVAHFHEASGVACLTQLGDIPYMSSLPEPWLRGPIEGVPPFLAPILYTFQHAREDLAKYTRELTPAQMWARPHGFGSVGFHIRHIAGSTDRLMTYLQGRELSAGQMAALRAEETAGSEGAGELLAELDAAFASAETIVRALDPERLAESRYVGRKRLPTTVVGLLTHIAEHIQRHVGQAISAAKLASI
ncbi:MAG: DinB family protein [Terriglobia bacterium]|nr:MAG: DinB family protein [Terriglobia bacterium]